MAEQRGDASESPPIRVLRLADVRALLDETTARALVREGFLALQAGRARLPETVHLEFPEARGEAHVKGAWLGEGAPLWAVKAATGFYGNPSRGLPTSAGLSLVFSAETGMPHTLILDGGWLTEVRTGAAGALSVELLAPPRTERLAMIGSGTQARHQLDAILALRTPASVVVYGPTRANVDRYIADVHARHGIDVHVAQSVREAVQGADLIVTTTPSREPLIEAAWVAGGCHIVAVGADAPGKRELSLDLLARADLVVVDSPAQAASVGEVAHGVAGGALRLEAIPTVGAIAAGAHPGREADDQLTISDLTGVGVQDAAVATWVVQEAARRGDVGTLLSG